MIWQIQVWLHFHEEVGELSRAFRFKEKLEENLREEVADSIAWLIAFCNKSSIDLGELIWQVYPGKCDVCQAKKCQCPKV